MSRAEPDTEDHIMLGYESSRTMRTYVAVCSCGWKSDEMSSAGLAYSAWDTHIQRSGSSDD